MPQFDYRDGHYAVEDVAVRDIAATCKTPFYCYSRAAIERAYAAYADAFADYDMQVCYALKANSNLSIVGLLAAAGAGADVVSGGELQRAQAAGIPGSRIVYSGVAKTVPEIELALDAGIRQFNVESMPELHAINETAMRRQQCAPVAFRINPDVDAETHEKISTGKSENKFGIPWHSASDAYAHAASLPGIEICGIDMHIGSQIQSLTPFRNAFARIAELTQQLRDQGHAIDTIDLGGGLGVNYGGDGKTPPTPAEYAQLVTEAFADLDCRLIIEPGRSLVGAAGMLVSTVIYVKETATLDFLIIDAAMNDFMRPSIYNAYHAIRTERQGHGAQRPYEIVGPVCETGDMFARGRLLHELQAGDMVVLEDAGAYGAVMASTYNTRPLVPEVLVEGNSFRIIRKRVSEAALLALDEPWPATATEQA